VWQGEGRGSKKKEREAYGPSHKIMLVIKCTCMLDTNFLYQSENKQ